jgi:phosphoketolase
MATANETSFTELDGYFRAANFLTVGQIHLRENPLLREPLKREHIEPRLLGHWVLHGRQNPGRFHVRGYREKGTTTTPFDMVVLDKTSRFQLVIEALRRAPYPPPQTPTC